MCSLKCFVRALVMLDEPLIILSYDEFYCCFCFFLPINVKQKLDDDHLFTDVLWCSSLSICTTRMIRQLLDWSSFSKKLKVGVTKRLENIYIFMCSLIKTLFIQCEY